MISSPMEISGSRVCANVNDMVRQGYLMVSRRLITTLQIALRKVWL